MTAATISGAAITSPYRSGSMNEQANVTAQPIPLLPSPLAGLNGCTSPASAVDYSARSVSLGLGGKGKVA
jgi:hypothetical protein